ncbi:phytoene/squalene synthase family protein [Hoyosella subflava]|uniref:Phytoene synthase n=1 Tax=Hoyosella subflava (strain DSM 45089 / JCM 17490 / NBRC 109087 / DQS3-9A1) TaxID=443218 RepID=F6EFE3_HOYSD|nr:phytoene/squalene synthase family protein [Hoyosella subflava]AEF39756.1 Phytoene synthase [Hoyosella subflava DQS3-9A1]
MSSTSSQHLALAYQHCRDITRAHGRSYYLATKALDSRSQSAIYALYAFARVVDDVVDEGEHTPAQQAAYLDEVESTIRAGFASMPLAEPVLAALCDTVDRYAISHDYFWAFLKSMRMDIPGTSVYRARYRTMDELHDYMYGSAAVIGLELLPVFGSRSEDAQVGAAALGNAFQLTNFLRDVADDYRRGRIYLPFDETIPFGATEDVIATCVQSGRTDPRMRAALAHLIAVTRSYYRAAEASLPSLHPPARLCVETALQLYGGILTEIERSNYQVFSQRIVVPNRRRIRVAAPRIAGALALRMRRS